MRWIVLAAGVVFLLGTGPPPASDPPAEEWQALAERARSVAEGVARVRGVRLHAVPDLGRGGDEEHRLAASRRAAAALTAERFSARGRAWSDIGLGDPDSPRLLYEKLAADLGGLAYDPLSRRVLVALGRLADGDLAPEGADADVDSLLLATGVRPDEPVLAHALVHALDRERAGRDYLRESTDATLAAAAWLEGEANLVALLYLFEGLGVGRQVVEGKLDPGSALGGALVPPAIDRVPGAVGSFLDFVYREGFAQASAAYSGGGWAAIDRAAASRGTTRDVLHPPAGSPVSFSIAPREGLPGFLLADSDSVGEQGILTLVSSGTGKDNLGLMAGDGWIADLLCRFEPAEGASTEGYTEWAVRLRSEQDAEELEYGLRRALESRFPGREISVPSPRVARLAGDGRVFTMEREGSDVRLRIVPESLDRRAMFQGGTSPLKKSNTRQK